MPAYAAIATIETGTFQHAQELVAISGDVRADLDAQDPGVGSDDAFPTFCRAERDRRSRWLCERTRP